MTKTKYIIEVEDEPRESEIPFETGPLYYCPSLNVNLNEMQLNLLDRLDIALEEHEADMEYDLLQRGTRTGILNEAKRIVVGDRDEQYGNPEKSFTAIAELWSAFLRASFRNSSLELSDVDVALMMVLLKVARATHSSKIDNYVDIAGYAACAGELEREC